MKNVDEEKETCDYVNKNNFMIPPHAQPQMKQCAASRTLYSCLLVVIFSWSCRHQIGFLVKYRLWPDPRSTPRIPPQYQCHLRLWSSTSWQDPGATKAQIYPREELFFLFRLTLVSWEKMEDILMKCHSHFYAFNSNDRVVEGRMLTPCAILGGGHVWR